MYRVIVAVIGVLVTVAGLIMVPLPGPGWLVVITGLFILASEFTWARQLADFVVERVRIWTEWIIRQPWHIRGAVTLATVVFVAGVTCLAIRIVGAPAWLPWVPSICCSP